MQRPPHSRCRLEGDLKTWIDTLQNGVQLSPELQAERTMLVPWFSEPLTSGYGLGLYELGRLLGHNGGILGYSSWMLQDPESKATIILVDNIGTTEGDTASGLIFGNVADLLFPGGASPPSSIGSRRHPRREVRA